ncbi:MAG TPA: ABC transporter permease [Candidatus Acidoferrales bacterium]|nr:ABC transporter permease [Candidatus Acidoferrales bacterium]
MPEWRDEIRKRLANLNLRPEREAEIVEELSAHLQGRYEEALTAGATAEAARRSAFAELDGGNLVRELRAVETSPPEPIPAAEAGSSAWTWDLWRDLRYGTRMLRKAPAFTAVAVLTLAIGIGANTAAFTIVNTFLLHPLPIQHASEMVAISTALAGVKAGAGNLRPISFLNLQDYTRQNHVFCSLAGYSSTLAATMTDSNRSQRVFVQVVTPNYFDTLGLRPVMGRFFSPEEDTAPGADAVAVIGHAAWETLFGGAANILGHTVELNGTPFTIIGIAPKGFLGVTAIFGPDLWVPTMMAESVLPTSQRNALKDRSIPVFTAAARLKPGVSLAQAQAQLKTVATGLAREFPDADEGQTAALQTLNEAAIGLYESPTSVLGSSFLLMAIVGLVLLIACSNVANLLLARGATRRREIALRMALGAGRGRLVRQLLVESLQMGLLGGAAGFLFGYAGCRLLWSLRPAETARNLADPRLSASVFAFTLVVAVLTGLLFGIAPALRSSRVTVVEALKEETRLASHSPYRLTIASALLVGQVAISLVLLVIATLFLRSLQRQYKINPGFQTDHLALFLLYPSQAGYDQTRTERFYKQASDRLAALPGVASVSWATNLPFWSQPESAVVIEGRAVDKKSEAISAIVDTVDVDYFPTLGIPILEGRDFTPDDRTGAAPVAIINDTMARQYWPHRDPVGQRIELPGQTEFRRIVGIARTADYQSLGEAPQPCIYAPLRQNYSGSMVLYVRTEREPRLTIPAIRTDLHAIDPGLPVQDVRTGNQVVDQALWGTKIGIGLLGVFGSLALGLASVGLYGVMAYSVNQRRREVGIRMALGASRADVMRLILRQGMTLVCVGAALGLVLSILAGRALSRALYGVSASDPPSLIGGSLLLLAVALLACYLPARSASRVDPQVALRAE